MKNFPLCNYKAPVVVGDGSLPYETKFITHKGFCIEVTYVGDQAVMYRVHERVPDFCQDYGGFVVKDGKVVAALGADGVGMAELSQEVAYRVVDQTARELDELVDRGTEITSTLMDDVWRNNLFPTWDMADYVRKERKKVDDHPEYYVYGASGMVARAEAALRRDPIAFIGATTLFAGLNLSGTFHAINLGDGGYAAVGDQVKSFSGGSGDFYRRVPGQIGVYSNGLWCLAGNIEYEQTDFGEGDLIAGFSDGCLKKSHTTPSSVANLLYDLRSNDLESLGLQLLDELAIKKQIPGMRKDWTIADDIVLFLMRG